MPVPTSKAGLALIGKLHKKMENTIEYLYSRWLDEKEYEDINDYQKFLEKHLPIGITVVKMNKRPFGFNFRINTDPGNEYQYYVMNKSVGWKRLK